jgi:hypothetical protein
MHMELPYAYGKRRHMGGSRSRRLPKRRTYNGEHDTEVAGEMLEVLQVIRNMFEGGSCM